MDTENKILASFLGLDLRGDLLFDGGNPEWHLSRWMPDTDLNQAFQVVDKIMEVTGWVYLEGPLDIGPFMFLWCESEDKIHVDITRRTRPQAIYAACLAAIAKIQEEQNGK